MKYFEDIAVGEVFAPSLMMVKRSTTLPLMVLK